jgi:hypothetical protein
MQIFDEVRKKFVALQPEEWVRQHCLHFILKEKKYPISLVSIEKQLLVHGQKSVTILLFTIQTAAYIALLNAKRLILKSIKRPLIKLRNTILA